MYRSSNELIGHKVLAIDGECGKVRDLLFDDASNLTRYLVVDTGNWLTERQVLISPVAIGLPSWNNRTLPTVLSRSNIEESPGIRIDQPVSRQYEVALASFHNWPAYWSFGAQNAVSAPSASEELVERASGSGDPNLHSVSEIAGCHIRCAKGELGQVEDIIIDTETWALRYLVMNTRYGLPGRKVIIAFDWITQFTWSDRRGHVELTPNQVRNAPTYDPRIPVSREYEVTLYDFYGRPTYW